MTERFDTNLKRFARFNAPFLNSIATVDCKDLEFCETERGELNLKKSVNEEIYYYYSNAGAKQEARQWFQELGSPEKLEAVIVYGIGLGHYYDAAKKWLKRNPAHYLMFIEDDLAVLHRFLETEKATEILSDHQVIVKAFSYKQEGLNLKFSRDLGQILSFFTDTRFVTSQLNFYLQSQEEFTKLLRYHINAAVHIAEQHHFESKEKEQQGVYSNYYSNLFRVPNSYPGIQLMEAFKGIPALICGAGPSLEKNFETIQRLRDHVLLFGAGTGMNALNRRGIMPQFGGALDPAETSKSRLKTNFAFEVPYCFTVRFFHEAFDFIHGPRIFARTSQQFPAQEWFDKELGLEDSLDLPARVSTTHFLLLLSNAFGCNPIVLAGVDLAYTDRSRYPKEVAAHPLDKRFEHQYVTDLPYYSADMVPVRNDKGELIFTKWSWFFEGKAYTDFAKEYPHTIFINATEGGLPFASVTHQNLDEVADRYLTKQYDILNLVHDKLQKVDRIPVTSERVIQVLNKWKKSLSKCEQVLLKLSEEYKCPKNGDIDQMMDQTLKTLKGEPAYDYHIAYMKDVFQSLLARHIIRLMYFPETFSEEELQQKKLEYNQTLALFLLRNSEMHRGLVETIISEHTPIVPKGGKGKKWDSQNETYQLEGDRVTINDPECGIQLDDAKDSSNHLHGPSRFFSDGGQLLAEGWFVNGKRQGKNWQYYQSGGLYSLQRFRDGMWHGKQEYYYEDGTPKTTLFYQNDSLDGTITLYYPNGQKERELEFSKGTLNGVERMWNPEGTLISETSYEMNQPVGTSREWYSNGKIKKEMVYHDSPDHFDLKEWDENGIKTVDYFYLPEALPKELMEESRTRRDTIEKIKERLQKYKE